MNIRGRLAAVRHRAWQRQLPKVFTLTELDPRGLRLEAASLLERQRIVNFGDEPEYLAAMLAELRPDDVLWDIGANIGLVSLHAARTCRAVAFEPDPEFRGRLERNLELNPGVSLEISPVAISDTDRPVTLYTDGSEGFSPSLVSQRNESMAIEVPAATLDGVVASGTFPRPTVVKLDIEGAEMLALQGGEETWSGAAAPRAMFIEIHDSFLPAFGSSAEEVRELVRNAGYEKVVYEDKRADQQHLIVERA